MASAVASLIEGRRGLPVGILPEESGRIAVGRRVPNTSSDFGEDDTRGESWVGCEELVFLTRTSARPGAGELLRRFYLLSKDLSTAVVLSPLGNLITEASLPRPGGAPPPIHLRPIYTFTWPSPVLKVVALLPPHTLKPDFDRKLVHLILVGFTQTGVHVQEGTISKSDVEELYRPNQHSAPPPPSQRPFFTPMRSHAVSPLASEASAADVDTDLGDTASFDWSRVSGFLCLSDGGRDVPPPLAPPVASDDSSSDDEDEGSSRSVVAKRPRGLYLWTAAHFDFALKYLG